MRQAILNLNLDSFFSSVSSMEAWEVGAVMLVAMRIAQTGPIPIETVRSVAGIKGKRQWIDAYTETKWFVREAGQLALRQDAFRVTHLGSDRPRGKIPLAVREAVHERDAYKCAYCGQAEGPFHLDHIVPISRGGADDIINLCLACPPCNLSKSDKLVSEWEGAQ